MNKIKILMTVTVLFFIMALTMAPAHADGKAGDEMQINAETEYQEVRQPPQHGVGREGQNDADDTENDVYRGPRVQPPKGVVSEDIQDDDEENDQEEESEEDRNCDKDEEQDRGRYDGEEEIPTK